MLRRIRATLIKGALTPKRSAFTLMEILVVIAIFAVLVTITGFVYASSLARSRDHDRLSDLQTISNGLEQFYLDHKAYPQFGDQAPAILLAKFRLEQYSGCQTGSLNGYLVPTYLSSVPEDPRQTMTVSGGNGSCDVNAQARQYVYVPLVNSANDPVHDFFLAAKVERDNNVSTALPSYGNNQLAHYRSVVAQAGLLFCTNTVNPSCTQNYFLGTKKNQ